MSINMIRRDNRGDTIIEVMFAMAIIGVVLAAAYGIASKNLQTSQLAKERTVATEIAESQIEQLKVLEEDPSATAFCLNIESAAYITTIGDINNVTEPACQTDFYTKSITKVGDEYNILVEWVPPGGSESNKARVVLRYKDYDFDLSGSSNLASFIVSYSGTSAVLGVRIIYPSGSISRGVVYGPSNDPVIGGAGVQVRPNGANADNFDSTLSPLIPINTYYARVYIETTPGVYQYGRSVKISNTATTPISTLIVTTGAVSGATATQATVAGTVTAQNGAIATERGIVYGTSLNPTISNSKVPAGSGLGNFSAVISITTPATYYARAYAIGAQGVVYGVSTVLSYTPASVNVVVMKIASNPGNITPPCSKPATLNRSGTSITLNGSTRNTNSSSTASFTGLNSLTPYTIAANSAPSGHELCSTSTTVTTGAGGSTVTNSVIKIRPVCYQYQSGTTPGYWTYGARRVDADNWYYVLDVNNLYTIPWIAPPGAYYKFVYSGASGSDGAGNPTGYYYGYDAVYVNGSPIYSMTCP